MPSSCLLPAPRGTDLSWLWYFCFPGKARLLGVGILLLAIILNSSIYILQGGQMYQTAWQGVYNDRAAAWNVYWDVILKNPFIGIGWGVIPQGALHAHNIYLSDAAQTGIFSIILILAFYIFFFYGSFQTEKRVTDPHLRAILLGSTATYFGQMFYSLTDLSGILVAFSATSISFLPYILIALPLAVRNLCQQQEEDQVTRKSTDLMRVTASSRPQSHKRNQRKWSGYRKNG